MKSLWKIVLYLGISFGIASQSDKEALRKFPCAKEGSTVKSIALGKKCNSRDPEFQKFLIEGDFREIQFQFDKASMLAMIPIVQKMPSLRSLRFVSLKPTLTPADIRKIAALKNLNHIFLTGPEVNLANVKALASLKSLTALNLEYNQKLADKDMPAICALKGLQQIVIHDLMKQSSRITDKSTSCLAKMPNLKIIRFKNTLVTEKGLENLRKAGINAL